MSIELQPRDAGTFASICTNNDIKTLISIDYGDTGKCNFYKTDDIFGNSPAAMAFPVGSGSYLGKTKR